MTSQAKIHANRQNAQNSTGPRSAEGKERARLNAIKHGLRSEEVVLPTESREQFDSFLAAWMDDWKPLTEARRYQVERAAISIWKLKRCQRNETSRQADRIKKAQIDWDKGLGERVEIAVRLLPTRPEHALAVLGSSRRGLERLRGLWNELVSALSQPEGWNDFETHHNRLCYLMGITGEDDSESLETISDASYRLMLRTNPKVHSDHLTPFDDRQAEEACEYLREVCHQKIAEIGPRYQSLPTHPYMRTIETERIGTEVRPEDALQHRYEARLEREAQKAMDRLLQMQKTGLDLVEDETEPPNEANPTVTETSKKPQQAPPKTEAPNEANAVPGQGLITQVDRDPKGLLSDVSEVTCLPMFIGASPSNP